MLIVGVLQNMFPGNGCRSSNCDEFHFSLFAQSVTKLSRVTRSYNYFCFS